MSIIILIKFSYDIIDFLGFNVFAFTTISAFSFGFSLIFIALYYSYHPDKRIEDLGLKDELNDQLVFNPKVEKQNKLIHAKTDILKNDININLLTEFIIKKKWFTSSNIKNDIYNLLDYKIEKIKEKSITCRFDKQIHLGSILFQLKENGLYTENMIKDIYDSNIILTRNNESIKGKYSSHKFKFKNTIIVNDEINFKEYF